MLCEFLFENRSNAEDYRNQDYYAKYLISKRILDSGETLKWLDLYDYVKEIYGERVNNFQLKKYLAGLPRKEEKRIALKSCETRAFKGCRYFAQYFSDMKGKTDQEKEQFLLDINQTLDLDGLAYFAAPFAARALDDELEDDDAIARFFHFALHASENTEGLHATLKSMNRGYDETPISAFLEDESTCKWLSINGFMTIGDLRRNECYSALPFLCYETETNIVVLQSLVGDPKETIKAEIGVAFGSLKERDQEILDYRIGFTREAENLTQIGERLGTSRQRINQIEIRASETLKERLPRIKPVFYGVYSHLSKGERPYIYFSDVSDYLEDVVIVKKLAYLVSLSSWSIRYDEDYGIFFDTAQATLDELCQMALEGKEITISDEEYKSLVPFEKAVVDANYRLTSKGIRLRKGCTQKDLLDEIFIEEFPMGYRPYNNDDYQKLKVAYCAKYGVEESAFPSAIYGHFNRLDYCEIDKGTYRSRRYCATLPDDLVERIISYVIDNGPTVVYRSIYEEFKKELTQLGVGNHFYLKGLIDPKFPDEFKTKQHYVSTTQNVITAKEALKNAIRSFGGEFSATDLEGLFPGVKRYTLDSALYEEEPNGLLRLGDSHYVYLSHLGIPPEAVTRLKTFIDNAFARLKTEHVSSNKIMAQMKLIEPQLAAALNIGGDGFALFSLIRALFPNDYGYSRPFISKDPNTSGLTSNELILNYMESVGFVAIDDIKRFCARQNIRHKGTYLDFIDWVSDFFVQVRMDALVKKEKLALDEETLGKISGVLTNYLAWNEELNTQNFMGYALMPKLLYPWNKYLLAGIVRSYFSDRFALSCTTTSFDSAEFAIKKTEVADTD